MEPDPENATTVEAIISRDDVTSGVGSSTVVGWSDKEEQRSAKL
jgi:hypothetical protein